MPATSTIHWRALALDLDVDPSTLSQILRGKRALTRAVMERFGKRLKLSPEDVAKLAAAEGLARATTDTRRVEELAHDVAAVIADGCHYAILELVRLECFEPDSRWIVRVLDIIVDDVNVALQRLLRLGLLEMVARNRWVSHCGDTTASVEGFTQAALERLSDEVRALSTDRRNSSPRDHSSTTLALDSRRLPEALALLARARRDLIELLERDGTRDDVYRLEIHFFPLTPLNAVGVTDDVPTRDAVPDPRETS